VVIIISRLSYDTNAQIFAARSDCYSRIRRGVYVNMRDMLFFIACIPLVISRGLARVDSFILADLPRFVAVIVVFYYAALHYKRLSRLVYLIIFYSIFIIAITLIYDFTNADTRSILLLATNLSMCIAIDLYFGVFSEPIKIIKYLFIIHLVAGIFNLVYGRETVQEGLYYSQNVWLLGQRNEIYLIYFNLLLYAVLLFSNRCSVETKELLPLKLRRSKKIKFWVVILFAANVILFHYLKTGGSFTATLVMFVALMLSKVWTKKANLLFLAILIFNFLIVFARVQNLFSYFIVDVLHRDLTLTGRIYVWDEHIRLFLKRPVFGYGFIQTIFIPALNGFWHPHNFILKMLTTGGISLVAIFCFLLFRVGKAIEKAAQSDKMRVVAILVLGYLIVGISGELETGYQLFPTLVTAWHISKRETSTGVNI
jgi:O-antigen ligase